MYAKLTFNSGTSTAAAIRDIVRLISDSNSGSANLSNLEFVNTSASELVAGVNSGWSVNSAGGTLPSSGTAVGSDDSNYILTGSTATSSKAKYCGIHANGQWTNSTVYSGTSFGFTVANVLDPGAATEMWSNGYTGTGSTVGNKHSILPTSVLHLWADPRRIIIHGLDGSSRKILITHMESAETPSTTGRSLPPVAVWCNVETGFNMNNQHELVSYRGDTSAIWDDQSNSIDFISFTGSTYCNYPGQESVVRAMGWHRTNGYTYAASNNSESLDWYCYRGTARSDNGTQYGTTYTSIATMNQNGSEFIVPPTMMFWGPANCHNVWESSTIYNATFGKADAQAFDNSLNAGIPRYPLVWFMPPIFNTDSYDFTSISGIWSTSANLGATGDTVTIGSDVYQYVAMGSRVMEALLIKRT